jgi:putative inorganic carbon (hco3(-)) transporter
MDVAYARPLPGFPALLALITVSAAVMVAGWFATPLTDRPEVVVALAALPIGVALCMLRPFIWCILFVLLAYFRIQEAYPFLWPLRLPLIVGIMCTVSYVWHSLSFRGLAKWHWPPEMILMLILFALVTVGVYFAQDRPLALQVWSETYWKIIFICVAIASLADREQDFRDMSRLFILGGALIAVVAIYNKLRGIGLVEVTRVTIGRELLSPLGDPNDLALVLLTPLSLALAQFVYSKNRISAFAGVAIAALLLGAIVATQSRGGLFGVIAVIGLMATRYLRSNTTSFLFAAVCAVGLFALMGISDRVSGGAAEIARSGIDDSARGRIIAWQAAMAMAWEFPLHGVGIANFPSSFYFYTPVWLHRAMAAHSTWFQILGETGFPGFLVFVSMVGVSLRSAWRTLASLDGLTVAPVIRAVALGLFASLIGFCISGSFLSYAISWPIYLLVALNTAMAAYVRRLTEAARA